MADSRLEELLRAASPTEDVVTPSVDALRQRGRAAQRLTRISATLAALAVVAGGVGVLSNWSWPDSDTAPIIDAVGGRSMEAVPPGQLVDGSEGAISGTSPWSWIPIPPQLSEQPFLSLRTDAVVLLGDSHIYTSGGDGSWQRSVEPVEVGLRVLATNQDGTTTLSLRRTPAPQTIVVDDSARGTRVEAPLPEPLRGGTVLSAELRGTEARVAVRHPRDEGASVSVASMRLPQGTWSAESSVSTTAFSGRSTFFNVVEQHPTGPVLIGFDSAVEDVVVARDDAPPLRLGMQSRAVSAAQMADGTILVVGNSGEARVVDGNDWSAVDGYPLQAGECAPSVVASVKHVVVDQCLQAAVLDISTGAWEVLDVAELPSGAILGPLLSVRDDQLIVSVTRYDSVRDADALVGLMRRDLE